MIADAKPPWCILHELTHITRLVRAGDLPYQGCKGVGQLRNESRHAGTQRRQVQPGSPFGPLKVKVSRETMIVNSFYIGRIQAAGEKPQVGFYNMSHFLR